MPRRSQVGSRKEKGSYAKQFQMADASKKGIHGGEAGRGDSIPGRGSGLGGRGLGVK